MLKFYGLNGGRAKVSCSTARAPSASAQMTRTAVWTARSAGGVAARGEPLLFAPILHPRWPTRRCSACPTQDRQGARAHDPAVGAEAGGSCNRIVTGGTSSAHLVAASSETLRAARAEQAAKICRVLQSPPEIRFG